VSAFRLLVVNYHYFREERYASGIYPTSRAALRDQVAALRREYVIASLADVLRWRAEGRVPSGAYCLLTIDDGLREQFEMFEFLRSEGVLPALFVPTAPLRDERVLAVHQLQLVRTRVGDAALWARLGAAYPAACAAVSDARAGAQYRYDDPQAARLKFALNFELPREARESFVRDLFAETFGDEREFARTFYMDRVQIRAVAAAGCLGSHGHAHVPLAGLARTEIDADLLRSRDLIEEWTGKRPEAVAYPYGGPDAVSDEVAAAASACGFSLGFTMMRGENAEREFSRPLLLRRVDTNDAPGGRANG
jgi:hypothetical protein